MKKTLTILCLFILVSCKPKIDSSNPIEVGKAFVEGLSKNDSTILKQIFINPMDSLREKSIEKIKEVSLYLNQNDNVQILKIDTTGTNDWMLSLAGRKEIEIYFEKEKVFHKAVLLCEVDSTNLIKVDALDFININEKCEKQKFTPYKPESSVVFNSIAWVTDYSGKTFKEGTVELKYKDLLFGDINYIKFRVILKRKKSKWETQTFFSQTVESNNKIFSGDIVRIEVPGMKNYFTGFKINQSEIEFDAELIEVKPKPKLYLSSCSELEKLMDKGN